MKKRIFLLFALGCSFLLVFFFRSPFVAISEDKELNITLKDNMLRVKKIADKPGTLDLVDIHKVNPNIKLDIRYATKNNVFGKPLYSSSKCYFRKHVAQAIDKIQKELEPMGLGLKIFDGYRPWDVQVEGYKRFPKLFSKPNQHRAMHPRGTAVDLTLVDKDGNDLLMPTEFDDTSGKGSRTHFKGIPIKALENREVLEKIMVKHGFVPLPCEWWHFNHYTWKAYPVIKLDFNEIEKRLKKQ